MIFSSPVISCSSALPLPGDCRETAEAVARAVGIPAGQVYAEVKPGGKAAHVAALQAAGRRVAMVGDGVNDASALAVANVGVAMGGGVDAAAEAAAIVLLGDRLGQVGVYVGIVPPGLASLVNAGHLADAVGPWPSEDVIMLTGAGTAACRWWMPCS